MNRSTKVSLCSIFCSKGQICEWKPIKQRPHELEMEVNHFSVIYYPAPTTSRTPFVETILLIPPPDHVLEISSFISSYPCTAPLCSPVARLHLRRLALEAPVLLVLPIWLKCDNTTGMIFIFVTFNDGEHSIISLFKGRNINLSKDFHSPI